MKILRIRLFNLNSLKGTHELDLTAEPLASAGLFAITGPTGAGKSTLLDAVTLALYGKAARYGNESNPEHVMSRHCGECSAEVEFEVPSGVYRAVWERHRAGKKASGKLQPPKRYIYDAAGEPLAQQIRGAEQKIEDLLGLNYDRFLRSVLLAQGDFARFLKARADERAELLESLTGTAIYSRLGRLAHTEASEREGGLKIKEAAMEQIVVLGDEERRELEGIVKRNDGEREKLKAQIGVGAKMLTRISGLESARAQENEALGERAGLGKQLEAAKSDLERLRRHRLTVPFAGRLATLESAEARAKTTATNRDQAEQAHAKAVSDLRLATRLLRGSVEVAVAACQRESTKAGEAVVKEARAAAETEAWLKANQADADLSDQVGDLAAAIGELKNARISSARGWTQWRQAAVGILPEAAGGFPESLEGTQAEQIEEGISEFLTKAEIKRDALASNGKEAKKQLELREDHLKTATLVAKLEDHRHDLKRGEACPLCGALEHPFAEGLPPGAPLAELQGEVERANKKLDEDREEFLEFSRALKELTSQRVKVLAGITESETWRMKLGRLLEALAIPIPASGFEDELRTSLQKRERTYRVHLKDGENALRRKGEAELLVRNAAKEAEMMRSKLGKLPEELGAEDLPDELPAVGEAEEDHAAAVTREKTTGSQLVDRRKDADDAANALEELRKPLEVALAESEFATLDALRNARLTTEVAKEIGDLDQQLGRRATAADALLERARQDIGKLVEEKVFEGNDAVRFRDVQAELQEASDELLAEQVTRRNQLQTDDENRNRRKESERSLKDERRALAEWRRLRELIGSHDGSKFRRYAQSISLDILGRHANRHLAKLSDRYLICRDEEEALNLQIEDLHQAGVRRPMASLSGGESFLVSLALALGLSDLAGRTVRIDSLFVDEGFGTLDPETLEVAISALESLRQDHKTVGVISHVALLKERIATQIVVEKDSGGISRVRVVS